VFIYELKVSNILPNLETSDAADTVENYWEKNVKSISSVSGFLIIDCSLTMTENGSCLSVYLVAGS
jgi:hypothetical protein